MQRFARQFATVLALVLASSAGRAAEPAPSPRPAGNDPLPEHAVVRLGTARWRVEGAVTRAALMPGGREVSVVSDGCPAAQVFDAATGSAVRRVGAPDERGDVVREKELSPDGRLLAQETRGRNGRTTVVVWDVASGRQLWASPPEGRRHHLVGFGPDGTAVLTRGVDAEGGASVSVRAARTGAERCRLEADPQDDPQEAGALAGPTLSADGRWVVTTSFRGGVWVWDAATGRRVRELRKPLTKPAGGVAALGHRAAAVHGGTFVAWDAVVTAKDETKLTLTGWDAATGGVRYRLAFDNNGAWFRATFAADGSAVVVRSGDAVALVDLATGRERGWLGKLGKAEADGYWTFSPDGKWLAVVRGRGDDRSFQITGRDARTGEVAWAREHTSGRLVYSADGGTVVAVTHAGGTSTLALWDATTGKDLRAAPPPGHPGPVADVAFAPGGEVVTVADGAAWSWDAAGRLLRSTRPPEYGTATALSPDARLFALHSADEVVIQRTDGGPPPRPLSIRAGVVGVAFDQHGKSLFVRDKNDTLRTFDTATGTEVRAVAGDELVRMGNVSPTYPNHLFRTAFAPDGRVRASGWVCGGSRDGADERSSVVLLIDPATGRDAGRIDLPRVVLSAVAFTPDGRGVVTACAAPAGGVRVWEVTTGKERWAVAADACSVAVSPDGRLLAAGTPGGGIRVWDLAAGCDLGTLAGHRGAVVALRFSPDGRRLASGGADTTSLVWDVAGLAPPPAGEPVGPPDASGLTALWADLGGADAARAFAAAARLARAPGAAAFVRDRVKPAAPADPAAVARLIADLGGDDFPARERATARLEALAEQAAGAVAAALAAGPTAEARPRLERVLRRAAATRALAGEDLRAARAVEVLERLGTADARATLRDFARGAAGARLTDDARRSLDRLGDRP